MRDKVITFFLVYFPIFIQYGLIYFFWYMHTYMNERITISLFNIRTVISTISSIVVLHIPIMIVFLLISLFIPTLIFFKNRQRHFAIAVIWWILFYLFDPGLKWFLD